MFLYADSGHIRHCFDVPRYRLTFSYVLQKNFTVVGVECRGPETTRHRPPPHCEISEISLKRSKAHSFPGHHQPRAYACVHGERLSDPFFILGAEGRNDFVDLSGSLDRPYRIIFMGVGSAEEGP